MGFIETYICLIYLFVLLASGVGAFNRKFDANIVQRLALAMMAVWSTWRIQLISEQGWGYPLEPLVASAIGLFTAGTILKTYSERKRQ